jgi:Zn finger protein HypA/HybF involved in hydrogenase expression
MLNNELIDKRFLESSIERVDDYINCKTKIKFKCKLDQHEWMTSPDNAYRFGCPKCGKTKLITQEYVDIELKKLNIERLDEYKNNRTRMKFKCLKDGYVWKTTFNSIYNMKTACPKCKQTVEIDSKELDTRLKESLIKRIGECKIGTDKIEFKCLNNNCNNVWKTTPDNIIQGSGCPKCSAGKSERRVMVLIEKYIKYEILIHHKYYYFNNRRYIPDFYLKIGNQDIFIERNGEQHYRPVTRGIFSENQAKEAFIKQQKRDAELRIYCKENNIILLEIPYSWKEDKIIEELTKLNAFL